MGGDNCERIEIFKYLDSIIPDDGVASHGIEERIRK